MLPVMNFYGSHNLDFENNEYDALEYYTISELRNLPIPDDILLIEYDSLREQFHGADISAITKVAQWCPISFPGIPNERKLRGKNIVSIGPMGMRIVFAPEYIILPSSISARVEWYSPNNKKEVQAWRSFYYSIINHFGGDHALYVDDRIINKYYDIHHQPVSTALSVFEQTIISQYGSSKKSLFDYAHGKYPKYYIDTFTDIGH